MEGKSMLKLSHVLAFLLLASRIDGIEVLQLPVENDGEFVLCPGKQSWPELVGKPAEYAKQIIQKENPIVHDVRHLFSGMPKPLSYICGRVFLAVNFKLIVRVTPSMG
ncbi:hypothetical protein MTR67_041288 [Solanum verrucosum]|uniref:Proteinase inhibitor I n=1 Tax=Solanum verrucosum TaxID=315347 RepID=A0AAF0UK38_SOLVR|nr:hypothetical protein MTR67_041288 [Solanum verrucosum]